MDRGRTGRPARPRPPRAAARGRSRGPDATAARRVQVAPLPGPGPRLVRDRGAGARGEHGGPPGTHPRGRDVRNGAGAPGPARVLPEEPSRRLRRSALPGLPPADRGVGTPRQPPPQHGSARPHGRVRALRHRVRGVVRAAGRPAHGPGRGPAAVGRHGVRHGCGGPLARHRADAVGHLGVPGGLAALTPPRAGLRGARGRPGPAAALPRLLGRLTARHGGKRGDSGAPGGGHGDGHGPDGAVRLPHGQLRLPVPDEEFDARRSRRPRARPTRLPARRPLRRRLRTAVTPRS